MNSRKTGQFQQQIIHEKTHQRAINIVWFEDMCKLQHIPCNLNRAVFCAAVRRMNYDFVLQRERDWTYCCVWTPGWSLLTAWPQGWEMCDSAHHSISNNPGNQEREHFLCQSRITGSCISDMEKISINSTIFLYIHFTVYLEGFFNYWRWNVLYLVININYICSWV